MKTLLLLRHAKSSWDDPSVDDFDRPLSPRGLEAAPRMGKELKKLDLLPDLVVCSPALRARQTFEAFSRAAGLKSKPVYEKRIYEASAERLHSLARAFPESCQRALMIGHNPGFENLITLLTGRSASMPTAALACIQCSVDTWKDVEEHEAHLEWLLRPKELAGA
jgi:phosphohistidine phosphatase